MTEHNYPETYHVKSTEATPEIKLDKENGKLEFSGRSLPENVKEFYKPAMEWLEKYIEEPNDKTTVIFNFEYFNTASSKVILDIIEKMKKIQEQGKELDVSWYYIEEDDDMLEAGEDYSDITDIPFQFVSYE